MANTREDNLMAWLRDAHAMEHQAIEMLEKMVNRVSDYPDLQARIRQHLDETHRQADMVLKCIERRGGSTSMVKDAAGKFIGTAQALSGLFVSDEVVKGALASCAFERYEASSYRILAATAEEVGDQETKRVCEELMRQEEAMGDWLWQHLPQVTRQFLQKAA